MKIDTIEIYPYKKYDKPRLKKIDISNICHSSEILEFIQEQYVKLYKTDSPQELITETLKKIASILKCEDAFLAINEDENRFNYYSMVMSIGGMSMTSSSESSENNVVIPKHTFTISSDNLLSRPLAKKRGVISNDMSKDPRKSNKIPNVHPILKNYLGFPIFKDNTCLGLMGFANSEKGFSTKDYKNLITVSYFFRNFIELLNYGSEGISISQELKAKQQLVSLKDSFIASMSHEMRTPLNGMIVMARLLHDSQPLTVKQLEYIRVLMECGVQLVELVNDILDFSKITSGNLKLNNYPFNLESTINSAIDIVKQRAEDKGLELKVEIQKGIPEYLNGDSRRIKQIVINLLCNAIKFTDNTEDKKGKIILRVNYSNIIEDSFKRKIIITVEDNGIGIKKEDQTKIFSVFTKVGVNKNTSQGAGLGLAISRELSKLMDGDITLESELDVGSIFKLEIILEDESILNKQAENTDFLGKKIIIVDDSEDNRIYLLNIFIKWGLNVTIFSTAKECLNYLDNTKNDKFDLAILDIYMPGMNGIDLAQALRERGYSQPLIGLSSIGESIQGREWFDEFETKPISKSHLFNIMLKQLLNPSKVSIKGKTKKGKNIRIILAEDDYYNQILFKEMLESLGYFNLKIVNNGKECVDLISKEYFDLCFIDIKMPIMNGIEAVKIIKKMPRYPPVIAVSASVLETDKSLYYSSGMDGYIPKPIDKDKLEQILKSFS